MKAEVKSVWRMQNKDSNSSAILKTIFSQRRQDKLHQPAWVGGLSYSNFPIYSISRQNATPNQIFLRFAVKSSCSLQGGSRFSYGRQDSENFIGGLQTDSALLKMKGVEESRDPKSKPVVSRPKTASAERPKEQKGVNPNLARPRTAGTSRSDSLALDLSKLNRLPHAEVQGIPKTNRPQSGRPSLGRRTAESDGTHRPDSISALSERIHVKRESVRTGRVSAALTDRSRRPASPSGGRSSSRACSPPVKSNFHLIHLRILELKSLAARRSATGEPLTHVRVLLSMAGFAHVSKPIRIANQASAEVPDETFPFEIDANIDDPVLGVRIVDNAAYTPPSRRAGDSHAPELSGGAAELRPLIDVGGERELQFKMSCDTESGCIPELRIRVRSECRRTDFDLQCTEEGLVFRKAGYVIDRTGITAFPQFYAKRGLPPGFSITSLKVSRQALSAERRWEAVDGLQVLRATDAAGHSYTLQRFRIVDGGPRGMLIAQLNGLIACPEHVATVLHDAFLDGLHAVVVLGDGGGFYLRDVLEVRGRLPEQNASIVLRQALAALRHLHGQGLVHNDVDARNLLISPLGQVRLCGFWHCAAAPAAHGGGRPSRRFAGPFVHMAPERILGLDCGFPADVWSLGIVAVEMLLGRGPHDMSRFAGPDSLFEFKRAVVSEPSPSLPRGEFSHDARLFVDGCLHKNIKLRATVQGLQSHFFIAKYESFGARFLGRWASKSREVAARARQAAADAAAAAGGRRAGDGDDVFLQACSLAHRWGRDESADSGSFRGVRAGGADSPTAGSGSPLSGSASPRPKLRAPPRATPRMTIAAAFEHMFLHPEALDDDG